MPIEKLHLLRKKNKQKNKKNKKQNGKNTN